MASSIRITNGHPRQHGAFARRVEDREPLLHLGADDVRRQLEAPLHETRQVPVYLVYFLSCITQVFHVCLSNILPAPNENGLASFWSGAVAFIHDAQSLFSACGLPLRRKAEVKAPCILVVPAHLPCSLPNSPRACQRVRASGLLCAGRFDAAGLQGARCRSPSSAQNSSWDVSTGGSAPRRAQA